MTTTAKKTRTKTKARPKKARAKKARAKKAPARKARRARTPDEMKNENGTYTLQTRAKYIAEMLEDGVSANEMSKQTGISQPTLSRWLRKAREDQGSSEAKPKKKVGESTGAVHYVRFDSVEAYKKALGPDGQVSLPSIIQVANGG